MTQTEKTTSVQIVVLSGAGISAESGLKTFRDSDGLWEEYNIMDVATPEAWKKNPALVLEFYNKRRKQLDEVKPNAAHYALARLQQHLPTYIITQNVDDLHERAGAQQVLHLHGELRKARSDRFPGLVYEVKNNEIRLGDTCERGTQLRPDIVWFGEAVPLIETAATQVRAATHFLVVGTSLNVYPAAGLLYEVPYECEKYLIDPNEVTAEGVYKLNQLRRTAGEGVPPLVEELIERYAG